MVVHRIGPWTDREVLRLDEASSSAAWAWEQTFLDAKIHGILFNELGPDGQFRRTALRLTRGAVAEAGRQLALEAAEMLGAGLLVYPTPGSHCSSCAFVTPCLAMQGGNDPEALLDARFRLRAPASMEEGRLGGSTWGMGRGAMPARFRGDER